MATTTVRKHTRKVKGRTTRVKQHMRHTKPYPERQRIKRLRETAFTDEYELKWERDEWQTLFKNCQKKLQKLRGERREVKMRKPRPKPQAPTFKYTDRGYKYASGKMTPKEETKYRKLLMKRKVNKNDTNNRTINPLI